MHIANPHEPSLYRAQIASVVGLPISQINIFAATPRPTDIAEHGVPCRTALAISAAPSRTEFRVIVSYSIVARYLEDWQEIHTDNGWLDMQRLLRLFRASAPRGWQPTFGIPVGPEGVAKVRPGQVIVVTYATDTTATPALEATGALPTTGTDAEAPTEDGDFAPPDEGSHGTNDVETDPCSRHLQLP